MDISINIDTWLVIVLVAVFIGLRVWHPITSYAGRHMNKRANNKQRNMNV